MKKLHLVASTDDLRRVMQYIQVKANKVCATNAHILAAYPDTEVFGFEVDEEIYFSAAQWKMQRMDKAARIERSGLIFKAFDKKGNLLGQIEALTAEQFTDKVGRFPEWNIVIPSGELTQVDQIAFDPDYYAKLTESLNFKTSFILEFRGKDKPIMLRPKIEEVTEATLLLMPVMFAA